jgi:prepilin-type N-terminal cleavage/methylation domain-containing protein
MRPIDGHGMYVHGFSLCRKQRGVLMQCSNRATLRNSRQAFTLIELLVVLAVIGILIAILLPAVQAARASARRTLCTNNMKQLGLAVLNYYDVYQRFPIFGFEQTGWTCVILPFIEADAIYSTTSKRVGSDSGPWVATPVSGFMCPDHPNTSGQSNSTIYADFGTRGLTNYLGVAGRRVTERYSPAGDTGILGAWVNNNTGVALGMIGDGVSNTLLMGERPPGPSDTGDWGWWAGRNDWDIIMYSTVVLTDAPPSLISGYKGCKYPAVYSAGRLENPCDQDHFWSLHAGGGNWTMTDGSVHFIPYNVSPAVIDQLVTRDQGEVVVQTW